MENQLQAAINEQKTVLNNALVDAIEKSLDVMGDDIMGIDWFSSHAESYNAQKELRAA
eukprot:CAMPEP_0184423364 /NCGR_PEP_ID=MMETSP0738-20130409/91160_1 /TAXON_ID=385413 /ORGANISM="Thalassiosira miniscula, Strain CCMP1093" /LENGTH=57 /DNA_ID=CAMNT_0026785413 /DNA_START=40 /DNA_END=213 /DNA_ORIENTATION=+